ncbi:MAG: hypothetical protein HOW73_47575 [Polyangiaceae bacterium]|nr:hypothetical protein [Polyangiaceae bacterium]
MADFYDVMHCQIAGNIQGELENVELDLDGQDSDVQTTIKEWGGSTPQPQKTIVRASAFVPYAGFEFDAFKAARARGFYPIKLSLGAKTYSFKGQFRLPKLSTGVGTNSKFTFEIHGEPSEWV